MLYRYLALLLVFTFSTAAVTGTTPTPPSSNSREAIMLIRTVNNQGVDDLMNLENTTPITTGGCSKCSAREEKKNFSLHNIREEILSKLGFTHPPNVTGKNLTVKASIYDLINKQHRGSPYDNMYSQHHWHQPGGMQSDDPSTSSSVFSPEDDDEDDAFFRMDRVLVISQPLENRPMAERAEEIYKGQQLHQYQDKAEMLYIGKAYFWRNASRAESGFLIFTHTVQGAILWVYLRSSGTSHNVPVNIEVRKLKPSSPNSNSDKAHSSSDKPYTERVTSKMEIRNNGTDGHWVLFDVKLMVAEWFKSPKSNLGIILEVTPPGEHAAIVTSGNNSNDDALSGGAKNLYFLFLVNWLLWQRLFIWWNFCRSLQDESETSVEEDNILVDIALSIVVPVLEIRIQDDRKSRMRRTIPFDCDENAKETRCCRSPLIVNFDDFGWDWVVAPRQYEAFYCNGECPYVFQTSTLNAHIVSQSKTAKVPLCCAPKKMSPLSMIYYNHDLELRYSIVPDSKVESCGCA
ncbi:growth/differentiation factor 8-like [Diaphorina citri]|uniref:Growth/differentiation factor 8-like n=1 Tax=Diaphorina citri TaxID=121845 RepID=A0A3Q0J4W9_DIACI|nr:growth/differentiation factor 8-like [Diaphorina citri]